MEEIAKNIWKLNVDSNIYFLDFKEKIIIDCGPKQYKDIVKKELLQHVKLEEINKVIFTHLHYDHVGNFDLFPNAEFFCSEQEIAYFKKNKLYAIGDPILAKEFDIDLKPIKELLDFDIIKTPGHTLGSFCLFYKKEKILFSGDTLFFNENYGRTDLPNSEPNSMEESLRKLEKIKHKILAPGHDY